MYIFSTSYREKRNRIEADIEAIDSKLVSYTEVGKGKGVIDLLDGILSTIFSLPGNGGSR